MTNAGADSNQSCKDAGVSNCRVLSISSRSFSGCNNSQLSDPLTSFFLSIEVEVVEEEADMDMGDLFGGDY